MSEASEDKWEKVQELVINRFGERLDVQTVLFLIGLQELGMGMKEYKKEEKLDIIHIGVCTVLLPYGYYKIIGKDDENWPHFKSIKKLPNSLTGELQQDFLKEAVIKYFEV
jgi:hypothetical protein